MPSLFVHRLFALLFCMLSLAALGAQADDQLLEPEKAFQFSAQQTQPDAAEGSPPPSQEAAASDRGTRFVR